MFCKVVDKVVLSLGYHNIIFTIDRSVVYWPGLYINNRRRVGVIFDVRWVRAWLCFSDNESGLCLKDFIVRSRFRIKDASNCENNVKAVLSICKSGK